MIKEAPVDLNISEKIEKDEEYRRLFFRLQTQNDIAEQIIKLRKKNDKTQSELATLAKTTQSAISRIEKAEYAKWNYQTLLTIAESLGARLRIIFDPIEAVIKQYKEDEEFLYTAENASVVTDKWERETAAPSQFGYFIVSAVAPINNPTTKMVSSPWGMDHGTDLRQGAKIFP